MTEPEFDKTADPVDVEQTEQGPWIRGSIQALLDIQSRKKDLDGERDAIQAELIPYLKRFGKPVLYRDEDGAPKVATVIEAETMTVDLDMLEQLVDPHTFGQLPIKRSVNREAFEHWCFVHSIPLSVVGPAVSVKTKKPYVGLG